MTVAEILTLTGGCVNRGQGGVVTITVPVTGEANGLVQPRTVPVLDAFGLAGMVERAARDAGEDGRLVGDINLSTRDPFGKLLARLVMPEGTPVLNTRRLRNTWMVTLLNGGVNIRDFMTFAGLRTTASLQDLAPYVSPDPAGLRVAARAGKRARR